MFLTSRTEGLHKGEEVHLDNLLSGISAGNQDALEQLYQHTSPAIYSFAFSILKNPHDAEDVLHDCYVAV